MIRLLCAVLAHCLIASNTQAAPFPLDQVFAERQFFLPKISPDGLHLAALLQQDEKQVLVQLELPGFAQQPLAYMDEAKLLTIRLAVSGNEVSIVS